MSFKEASTLTFEEPDMDTFRCLKLAYEAGKMGGNMPAIYNGANEIAVELFLDEKISYLQIEEIIESSMKEFEFVEKPTLDQVLASECIHVFRSFEVHKFSAMRSTSKSKRICFKEICKVDWF